MMEVGFKSPLLDLFRRGEVARDVKMMAAQGALAPRAHEQLVLLAALAEDADAEVRAAAETTIGAIPRPALGAFLARSEVSAGLRDFFAARGVQPAGVPAPDSEAPLVDRDDARAEESAAAAEQPKQGTLERLAAMTVAGRVKVAMKGSREERAILIRDPNKLVSAAVLSSPKLNEAEVETFAKMANVSDEVLRIIGHARAWTKSYGVVSALARNRKTPPAVSLSLVHRLNDRDLKMISLDRNAPEPLRLAVRKRLTKGKAD